VETRFLHGVTRYNITYKSKEGKTVPAMAVEAHRVFTACYRDSFTFFFHYYHFIHCLHSMDYGDLSGGIYSCDRELVCQMHLSFLQLFVASNGKVVPVLN
jgi:hypothetical protein